MTVKRRRFLVRVLPWLVVFAAGTGTGYYVRDRQQADKLREAAETAQREMERAGLEAIERARRAGEELRAGAQAAAESTRAAFRDLIDSKNR